MIQRILRGRSDLIGFSRTRYLLGYRTTSWLDWIFSLLILVIIPVLMIIPIRYLVLDSIVDQIGYDLNFDTLNFLVTGSCIGIWLIFMILLMLNSQRNMYRYARKTRNVFRASLFSLVLGGSASLCVLIQMGVQPGELIAPPIISNEILENVSVVCQGSGIEQAAVYSRSPGIHPLIILDLEGNPSDLTNFPPAEWIPTSLSQVELVACLEGKKVEIESCSYEGGVFEISRFQNTYEIRIMAAHTGELLEEIKLEGELPRPCRDKENNLHDIEGEGIGLFEVLRVLRNFAEISDDSSE